MFDEVEAETLRLLDERGVPVPSQAGPFVRVVSQRSKAYEAAVAAAASAAAAEGSSRVAAILDQAGISVSADLGTLPLEKLRAQVFQASEFTMDRVSGDVMASLAQSYADGVSTAEAAVRLREVFTGMKDWQLERIAATEIGGADNFGAYTTLMQFGQFAQWWTAEDERVRSSHAALHGQIVRVGDPFANGLRYPGDRSTGRPAEYVNCFPAGTTVRASSLEHVFKRWYEGVLVEVVTTTGKQLAGTPNHPVLTLTGWKPLGLLEEGDGLICGCDGQEVGLGDGDVDNAPTMIEQVFEAALAGGQPQRIAGVDVDFHGDGRADCEVEIVRAHRELRNRLDAALTEPERKLLLACADLGESGLPADSLGVGLGITDAAAAPSMIGCRNQAQAFGRVGGGHSSEHGLASVTRRNACGEQDPTYDVAGDGVLSGQGQLARTTAVSVDDVCGIRVRAFSGHVYNLQTGPGVYIANGIVAHNCRCILLPWFVPLGGVVPPGRPWFTESDVVIGGTQ